MPGIPSTLQILLQERFQKVMQFFVHLGAVIHRVADLVFDDVAKAAAEPVNGYFDRAFVQVEVSCRIGLRNVLRVAGQPGFERFELVGLPCGLVFLRKSGEGAVEKGESPFAVEQALETGCVEVRQLQAGRSVGAGIDCLKGLAGAAFQAMSVIAHVGEEMFRRAEQKGSEPAPLRINVVDTPACQETGEELLCEITRGIFVRGIPPDEGKYRSVIGSAQLAQRGFCIGRIAARLQHSCPLRGDESFRAR